MKRAFVLLYGVISYILFLVAFLYAIGFTGNLLVPKSIDSGISGPMGTAIIINMLILGLFAVQHSIMARPWFKKAWTKIIPESAERSTFVLLTSLILLLLFWQWRPAHAIVWNIENTTGAMIMNVLFYLGWFIVLTSTFVIDHFELFGLKQVLRFFFKKEFTPPPFTTRLYYKHIRHPIMFGFIVAFWATPTMTMGHMLFTLATTGYILIGIMFEEKDLNKVLGERYKQYSNEVPMLIPFSKKKKKSTPTPDVDGTQLIKH